MRAFAAAEWHTLGRWLRGFDAAGVQALLEVNERLVAEVIEHSGLARLTLDVDGSVVSTGLRVEGARRGFNPHRRKVPSYYPITAYEANTGQVLRVCNRAGNVHDGKASVAFLGELFEQLDATLERRPVLEMRMDEAFFQAAVIDVLEAEGALYAIKAPFGAGWDSKSASPDAEHGSVWTTRLSVSISGFGCRPGHASCVSWCTASVRAT